MQISDRLNMVAGLVTEGLVVCDVGTDHGYIPIKLVKEGKVPKAYAMDINEGPLERARKHISENKLEDRIVTRLSDGMMELREGEAESVVIAGMGGMLITRILENAKHVLPSIKELIISPHTEISIVREYLVSNGFEIKKEDMIYDMGKYYTVIKAIHTSDNSYKETYLKYNENLIYGKYFLDILKEGKKHKVFYEYLENEVIKYNKVLDNLKNASNAQARADEIKQRIEGIKKLLNV